MKTAMSKYMKEKRVTGFTKDISCISSCAVDNGRTLDAVHLELSKVCSFDIVYVGEI